MTARIIASLENSVRGLRPPALKLFCTQSSHGKISKEEPWTLGIISYSSDKLSSIFDYFTLVDRQKLYFTNFSAKVRCYLFITSSNPHASPSSDVLASHLSESPRPSVLESPRPHVPASARRHVATSPSPRVPTSPRPRVPESPSPKSQVPRPRPTSPSHVPVPLLVTAILYHLYWVLASYVSRGQSKPRFPFSRINGPNVEAASTVYFPLPGKSATTFSVASCNVHFKLLNYKKYSTLRSLKSFIFRHSFGQAFFQIILHCRISNFFCT